LLLAGGRSQRFGAEKALAAFQGVPMMDVVARRFVGVAAFAVSARPRSATELHALQAGLTVLHDDPSAPPGPLSGVCVGLRWAQDLGLSFLATAPCDVPLLPVDLFPRLLDVVGDAPAAFAQTGERMHPLCGIWNVRLLAPLTISSSNGEHPAVRRLLTDIGAVGVFFPDERAFSNANTPVALTDLERAA
jgi:molybdopterin-guanine dinucleotide biosynthesis protein A